MESNAALLAIHLLEIAGKDDATLKNCALFIDLLLSYLRYLPLLRPDEVEV